MLPCLPGDPVPLPAWETALLSTDGARHLLGTGSSRPKARSRASLCSHNALGAAATSHAESASCPSVPSSRGTPAGLGHICPTCVSTQKPRPEDEGSRMHSTTLPRALTTGHALRCEQHGGEDSGCGPCPHGHLTHDGPAEDLLPAPMSSPLFEGRIPRSAATGRDASPATGRPRVTYHFWSRPLK